MNLDAILDEITRYLEWTQTLPFGAPTDVEAYEQHLLNLQARSIASAVADEAIVGEVRRIAGA